MGMFMGYVSFREGIEKYCLEVLTNQYISKIARENPHVQQEVHLQSGSMFHCHVSFRGVGEKHRILCFVFAVEHCLKKQQFGKNLFLHFCHTFFSVFLLKRIEVIVWFKFSCWRSLFKKPVKHLNEEMPGACFRHL